MGTNKLVVGMLLIVISIAAIIFFISLSWRTLPLRCWEDLNGSKKDILASLKICAKNCWSKHDFGKDITIDDCYIITIFSQDKDIEKKDFQSLDENIKSYLDTLYKNTPYKIKVRYNYTGPEISIVNMGICGNKIKEEGEECDNDVSVCTSNEFLFGKCTDKYCTYDCMCGELNCFLPECLNGIPESSSDSRDTDWCKFCKLADEHEHCNDKFDNDCDGFIDNEDPDCSSWSFTPPQTTINCGSIGQPISEQNICLENKKRNGIPYPAPNNKIKIKYTDPSKEDSCDSPKCMYAFVHDPEKPYLDPYDDRPEIRKKLKQEIESQLETIEFLGMRISVNKKIVEKFKAVEDELNNKYQHNGATYKFPSGDYTFINGGSYNFRYNVNNPTVLSPHAFGLAIDLNPQENIGNVNDMNPCTQPSCKIDIPPEVVEAFENHNFRWGGRFWCKFDPMHFEYIPSCIITQNN